jgi:hypothetical protein
MDHTVFVKLYMCLLQVRTLWHIGMLSYNTRATSTLAESETVDFFITKVWLVSDMLHYKLWSSGNWIMSIVLQKEWQNNGSFPQQYFSHWFYSQLDITPQIDYQGYEPIWFSEIV